ncbi:MAG: response regulator [Proteobacteria bacterium]|nr:response regulator [Pseudomonadota bacterium]MBU1715525.1 response regulator [Pseudomonadota bacterium]
MAYILVIDDDYQFRKLMNIVLTQEGHEVAAASDGYVGLAMCLDHLPDVVVTDMIMPNKEGLGTIIDLKKEYPNLKIIAVSGGGCSHGSEDYLELAEKHGADFCFSKPFKAKDLVSVVGEMVAN